VQLYKLGQKLGSLPKQIKGSKKIEKWRKILRIRGKNFGASGCNVTKLFHLVCCKAKVKIWLQFFLGLKFLFFGHTTRRDFGQL